MNYYWKLWRWRRNSLDCSIAIIIGALSATLARAFRTPYAPSVAPSLAETSTNGLVGVHAQVRRRLPDCILLPKPYKVAMERITIKAGVYSMRTNQFDVFTNVSHGPCSWEVRVDGAGHLVLLHQKRPGYRYCRSRSCDPASRRLTVTDWSLAATVERGIESVGLGLAEVVHRVHEVDGQRRGVELALRLDDDSSRLDELLRTNSSAGAGGSAKPRKRKPPTYWAKEENVRREIAMFWAKLGIESDKVPNQTLLQYFGAHGLRHACGIRGSCQDTANWLGVEATPGKWNEALLTPEIVRLRESGKLGADGLIGPRNGATSLLASVHKEWPSQSELERGFLASARKTELNSYGKNYWTSDKNFRSEMTAFNSEFQAQAGLPSVWMVRPTEMNKSGRRDLVNAIQRTGGYEAAVERLGMVHVMEWKSFMDQLETLRELRNYLTVEGVVQKNMPTLQSLKAEGKTRLKKGIVLMGGRKLVARKMGLNYKPPGCVESSYEKDGMDFGRFDLDFAVKILEFVLRREYARSPVPPPRKRSASKGVRGARNSRGETSVKRGDGTLKGFRQPSILLPRREVFMAEGRVTVELVHQIEYYGGYENVARRLHLGYHYEDEAAYQEKAGQAMRERNERQKVLKQKILALQQQKQAAEEQERLAREREVMRSLKRRVEDRDRANERAWRAAGLGHVQEFSLSSRRP